MDQPPRAPRRLNGFRVLLALIILVLAALACNFPGIGSTPEEEDTSERGDRPITGSLQLGQATSRLDQPLGPEGGTFVVDAPGESIDGLTIDVPAGAYETDRRLHIETRPIEEQTFGANLNPDSDLISVDVGEGLSNQLLTVSLPYEMGADQYAMAFAYEADSGTFEAMTPVQADSDRLTVVTRDLSRDFLISTIALDRLEGDIDTGFRHGVDDWQFTNYGSVLSPGGHCAGQSLTALYYYIENLGPPLFGQYDNYDNPYPDTPNLMWDDVLGYRLASVAQETVDWDGEGKEFWIRFGIYGGDRGTFNAFAYSMLLTNEPQFLGIYGKEEDGEYSGHALIIYGKQGDRFLVSDPNYPFGTKDGNDPRYLTYNAAAEKFDTYYSGPNAKDKGFAFTEIFFIGYKDLINWDRLGELWDELEAGIVGQEEFPTYELAVRSGDSESEDELWFNYEADSDEISVRVRDAAFDPFLVVYDAQGNEVVGSSGPVPLTLREGDNFYGFEVDADTGAKYVDWVGFNWIKIIYQPEEAALSTVEVEEPFSLCDLLPEGGSINNTTESLCAKSYPGGEDDPYVVVTHHADTTAADYCQTLKDGNYGAYYLVDLYGGHDCGYVVLDVDYGTQNVRLDGGWWVAFVEDNYYVKVHSGNYVRRPDNEAWVMDTVHQIEGAISEHLQN